MKGIPVLQPICCVSDVPVMQPNAAADLAATFKALADPTRVAIVNRLSTADSVCVCDLTAAFELSQPTISHHLRILREAGIADAERNAPVGPYSVDFFWRAARVAVEVDSYQWHSGPAAFKRDRRKDAYLRDHGLDVIRVSWEMLDQPLPLVARIVQAIERRTQKMLKQP